MSHFVNQGFDSLFDHVDASDMNQKQLNKIVSELNKPPSNNLGASSTNMADVNAGALGGLDYQGALDLIKQISPAPKPVDKNMLGLLYFTEMAKQASQPGATLLLIY